MSAASRRAAFVLYACPMLLARLLIFISLLALAPSASTAETAALPISSRAQLDAWLDAPDQASALEALSPGARERFLSSLAFGRNGLGGFDSTDLAQELDAAQIRAVLALFAVENYAAMITPVDARSRSVAAQRRQGISELERRYNGFYFERAKAHSSDADDLTAARIIEQDFLSRFGADNASPLGDSDLQLLLRAANDAAAVSDSPRIGAALLNIWNEAERRQRADTADVARIFNALLASRRFDDAAALAQRHPDADLPVLPRLNDTENTTPNVWEFSADGNTMTRRGFDLEPLQIIVSAGCHFSADAATDIGADPVLGPVFAAHAHWLALPPGRESLDALRAWNREHPHAPMLPIHDRAEWALIPRWAMPTFHIVKDGKVIDSISGWISGDASFREQLLVLLARNGLLQSDASQQAVE